MRAIIKVGPRGGKIIGFAAGDLRRPIYQRQDAAGGPQMAPAEPGQQSAATSPGIQYQPSKIGNATRAEWLSRFVADGKAGKLADPRDIEASKQAAAMPAEVLLDDEKRAAMLKSSDPAQVEQASAALGILKARDRALLSSAERDRQIPLATLQEHARSLAVHGKQMRPLLRAVKKALETHVPIEKALDRSTPMQPGLPADDILADMAVHADEVMLTVDPATGKGAAELAASRLHALVEIRNDLPQKAISTEFDNDGSVQSDLLAWPPNAHARKAGEALMYGFLRMAQAQGTVARVQLLYSSVAPEGRPYFDASVVNTAEGPVLAAVVKTAQEKGGFRKKLAHEIAHSLERLHPELFVAMLTWQRIRSEATFGGKAMVVSLAAVAPWAGYGKDERALADEFMDPYVGKFQRGATEVVSTGFAAYMRDPREFAAADFGHFCLIDQIVRMAISSARGQPLAAGTASSGADAGGSAAAS